MRALSIGIATLLVATEIGAGCGGGTDPTPAGDAVLTTLEVTPANPIAFTVAPGNSVTLTVVAKDQNGRTMIGAGAPSFASDNIAIASVTGQGIITALAPGTAQITTSLTAGGVTKTGTAMLTARLAAPSAAVFAPETSFEPGSVDVQPNGTVNWTFGLIPHNVVFTTAGAPVNIAEFSNSSTSRTFPTHGSYAYRCLIHPGMAGVVNVH
jgi:plastocyanin